MPSLRFKTQTLQQNAAAQNYYLLSVLQKPERRLNFKAKLYVSRGNLEYFLEHQIRYGDRNNTACGGGIHITADILHGFVSCQSGKY